MGDDGIRFDPTKSQQVILAEKNSWIEYGVTYHVYRGLSVNNMDGTVLMDFPNQASRCKVFVAPSIRWQPDQRNASLLATHPKPPINPPTPNPALRYPPGNYLGVVLFQPPGKVLNIEWTQPNVAAIQPLTPQVPIYFNVNDLDDAAAYARHAGSYDVLIAHIFP
jgi:hypothetical protein